MVIVELTARFHLSGVRSLKAKRSRLRGLRDRFGKQPGMAVCESGAADDLHNAQWSFVAVAGTALLAGRMLDDVEQYLRTSVDAVLVAAERSEFTPGYRSMSAVERGSY